MSKNSDGGSIYPRQIPVFKFDYNGKYVTDEYGIPQVSHNEDTPGMSLRDYFASAALQGWRANSNGRYTTYAEAAAEAYIYADAMLEARETD